MKQYNQDDINNIISITPEEKEHVKEPEKLEIPQDEYKEKESFTHEQLSDALLYAEDLLERSMIPFMLLGETAEALFLFEAPVFEGNLVHIGVLKRHLTDSTYSTLKSLAKEYYADDNIFKFEYKGVPIEIDIIHNQYPFFQNLDSKFYALTTFRIPNPFEEYYKWKDQIK